MAGSVESAHVAHSDAVRIMPQAVGSHLLHRATSVDLAIEGYHIMVTDVTETARTMPRSDLRHAHSTTGGSGRAVDDDFFNAPHGE